MLSNELDHLPLMWEPFWSPTIGVALALLVPTIFFMIFGTLMFQARVAGVFVAIMTLAELAALYFLVYDMQPFTGGFPGLPAPQPFKAFGISIDPIYPTWLLAGSWSTRRHHAWNQGAAAEQIWPDCSGDLATIPSASDCSDTASHFIRSWSIRFRELSRRWPAFGG